MNVPYLSSTPAGADMNALWVEMDRRMGLALDGLNPWMRPGRVRSGDTGTGGTTWASFGSNVPAGCIFAFKGTGAIYLRDVAAYTHSVFVSAAAAATEVSRDDASKTMTVHSVVNLDASLQVHTRSADGNSYWLIPDAIGVVANTRALRRHRYAVAEILVEGLSALTIPAAWNRFECFRVANFSPMELTVTVEVPGGSSSRTVVVPKYGCRAIRRTAEGFYDASLSYFWKFRNSRGRPRFWQAGGSSPVEASAAANNLAAPVPLFFAWFTALGWKRDPRDSHTEEGLYPGLFGNPASASTPVGDLVHHFGAVWSVKLTSATNPLTLRKGRFHGHETLASELADIGVTAVWSGTAWTLSMTAPASPEVYPNQTWAFDLFAPGSNLLTCAAASWSVPLYSPGGVQTGTESHATPGGLRLYRPLPVTLPGLVYAPGALIPLRGPTATRTETVTWQSRVDEDNLPVIESRSASWDVDTIAEGGFQQEPQWTVRTRLDALSSGLSLPVGASLTWSRPVLTPQGWRVRATYSRRLVAGPDSNLFDRFDEIGRMNEVGLYDELAADGRRTIHSAAVISGLQTDAGALSLLDWPTDAQPGALYPGDVRHYGQLVWLGSGAMLEAQDFSDILSKVDGGDITPTSPRQVIDREDLSVLTKVAASSVNSMRNASYGIFPESDEGRSVIDGLVSPSSVSNGIVFNRMRFAAGIPVSGLGNGALWFFRKPLSAHDYNLVAWSINTVRRMEPVYALGDFLLDAHGLTIPANEMGITEANLRPAAQWCRIVDAMSQLPDNGPTVVDRLRSVGIQPKRSVDLPGWSAAKAAYRSDGWRVNGNVVRAETYYWQSTPPFGYQLYVSRVTSPGTVTRIPAGFAAGEGPLNCDIDIYGFSPSSDYWWLDTATVRAWAATMGLPCRTFVHGVGLKLQVRETVPQPWLFATSGLEETQRLSPWGYFDTFGSFIPYQGPSDPVPDPQTVVDSAMIVVVPQRVIRLEPAVALEDVQWVAAADPGYSGDGWLDRGAAWRVERRQRSPAPEAGPWPFDNSTVAGNTDQHPNGLSSPLPPETSAADAHEEQTIFCGWTLRDGDQNESRLLLIPQPVKEIARDWYATQENYNLAAFENAEPPASIAAPDESGSKSIGFSAGTNLYRADSHELWSAQLWRQVFIPV